MNVRRVRENVVEVTATTQELSALAAAARLTRDTMLDDPRAPVEALRLLERVLADYDRAIARLRDEDGRRRRPS